MTTNYQSYLVCPKFSTVYKKVFAQDLIYMDYSIQEIPIF